MTAWLTAHKRDFYFAVCKSNQQWYWVYTDVDKAIIKGAVLIDEQTHAKIGGEVHVSQLSPVIYWLHSLPLLLIASPPH